MALKTTTAAALQHGHRRRLDEQALVPMAKRSSQLTACFMAEKRLKHEQRKIKKQQQQQHQSSTSSSATATPEPATATEQYQGMSMEKKEALQQILGRSFDEKDRSAADILATLYMTGLLDRKTPAASEGSASGTTTPAICEDNVKPSEVALPSMQQTEVMLEVWHSERGNAAPAASAADSDAMDTVEVEATVTSSPMTPALSASSSASARSSFSIGSPATENYHHLQLGSPVSQYAHMPTPSGPPPPPYDEWRKSIAHTDASAAVSAASHYKASSCLKAQTQTQTHSQGPFLTYEQNYFCSSRGREASGANGMPSPPQSPTNAGRPSEYSYKPAMTLPTLPSLPTLPTPPQLFSASMQSQHYSHSNNGRSSRPHAAYQLRYHHQYELPRPVPTHRRSMIAEDIATTVVTLPPPVLGGSRETLTPVSPLTPPSAFGRRSTMPTIPSMATMMNSHNSHYNNHNRHNLSPRMAAKMDDRRDRLSLSASSPPSSNKKGSMPKPHCNVKYETAELDFIMYQRTTKNRAWDDVTASFNAALPRLRQYADMDYARLGGPSSASSPGSIDSKAAMDRYRARPERTTPGLQASYYRQRLALPLLNESGLLVFDDTSNKQIFTEVMVRDDKSRKNLRRLNSAISLTGPTAAGPSCPSTSSTTPSKNGVNPDDARVHLVLYFPERVTYYDYWFVSEEDKALARQRTYERNMQRHQRGLPAWRPGNDDPDSGILTRSKD